MSDQQQIIDRIFDQQGEDGFWKTLPVDHQYFPIYSHYVPNFRASLWVLILLADLKHTKNDQRIKRPLKNIQKHFFDSESGIFCLKKDHFPIPCLNGNMIYLDNYFNGAPGEMSKSAIEFFEKNQRFDDGTYFEPKNVFCSNKSCYGKHSCYWGVTKLLKGLSFIPKQKRSVSAKQLIKKCIDFVLLHKVCFSSRTEGKISIAKIDQLTFPNMYKSDMLELLWLLKREKVWSDKIKPALEILRNKVNPDGSWNLERKTSNLITSIGSRNKTNAFITQRAREVLNYYHQS